MNTVERWVVVLALFSLVFGAGLSSGWAGESPADERPERFDRLNLEEETTLARAELVGPQTVHGMVVGGQFCLLARCDGPRAISGSVLLGAGAGLGGSLLATRNGITSGQASAMNWGTLGGLLLARELDYIVGPFDDSIRPGQYIVGQLGGLAGGYLLSEQLRPTSGDISTVTHATAWSVLYFELIVHELLGVERYGETTHVRRTGSRIGRLTTAVAGGVGGAVLASQYPMSRARVWMTSLSGVLGGLVAGGVPALIFGDRVQEWSPRVGGALLTVGTMGGLATGGYLTRDWDQEEYRGPKGSVSLGTPEEGRGLTLGFSGYW